MTCSQVKGDFEKAVSRVTEGFECIEITFNNGETLTIPIDDPSDSRLGLAADFPKKGRVTLSYGCPTGWKATWPCSDIKSITPVKC